MKRIVILQIICFIVMGQGRQLYRVKTPTYADEEYDKYTTVSQIGLTLTNFGIIGNGWNQMEDGSIHPSCQYKQHTEIAREQVEHFSYAGLWIGGIVNGQRRVSTAIVDGVFEAGDEGFEFFAQTSIEIQSSISSTTQDSMADFYSPYAISHQDMIAEFKDYGISSNDNQGISNHTPLGIDVRMKAYSWNYSYTNSFVILNYTITNSSPS